MAEAHSRMERDAGDVEGLDDIVAVTEEVVDGVEGSAIPLFVGWRNATRCATTAGRVAQLMQILREWRGGLHLVATTAVGLSPLEAILTNEGPGQAKFFGWSEPFPDFTAIKAIGRSGRDDRSPPRRRWPRRWTAPSTPPSRPGFAPCAQPRRSTPGARPARPSTGYSEGLLNGRTTPTGEHDGSSPPRTCGAARSARRPVKAEVAGSNPVRSAARFDPPGADRTWLPGRVAQLGRARA